MSAAPSILGDAPLGLQYRTASGLPLGSRKWVRRPVKLPMRYLVLLLLSVVSWKSAAACQCGEIPRPEVALANCDAVFDGILLRRTPVLVRTILGGEKFLMVFEENEFLMLQAWRSAGTRTMVLLQGVTNCSSHFTLQRRYLVFAQSGRELPGRFSSSICLPTQSIENATRALARLGPASRVYPVPALTPETRSRGLARHGRAALLLGVAATVSCIESPATALRQSGPVLLLGPFAVVLAASVLLLLAIRRRFRLFALLLVPDLFLVAFAFLLEGYLLIRSIPLLWYLLDFRPGAV